MRDMSDDQKLRQNTYKFVTEALRVTQPTAVKVLRLILENPGLTGIQFSRPKDPDRLSQAVATHQKLLWREGIEVCVIGNSIYETMHDLRRMFPAITRLHYAFR